MGIVFNSGQQQDIRENIAKNSVIYTAQASHDDSSSTVITYGLAAGHPTNISINATTGAVSISDSPDYESGTTSYGFTVIANDNVTSVSQAVTVNLIDVVEGDATDETFTSTTDDDVVDGGGGYNTFAIAGTPDAFMWTANSHGEFVVTDYVTSGDDLANSADHGVDTLINIQRLAFVDATDSTDNKTKYVYLDDYANTADANNTLIEYGVEINARLNYTGDTDNFVLQAVSGQRVIIDFDSSHYVKLSAPSDYSSYSLRSWRDEEYTQYTSGDINVQFSQYNNYDNPANGSSPNSSQSYSFTYRRVLETGTDGNDSISLGQNYEWLDGKGGDDTIQGSARSDVIKGGDGNDTVTGGGGNDSLDGGAGNANVAVYSGARSDYDIRYLGGNFSISVKDSVANRDGEDTIQNFQILRFADQDLVLDAESNTANPNDRYVIGQTISGSIPITPNGQQNPADKDYVSLVMDTSVTADTVLRLSIDSSGLNGYSNGNLEVQVFANGSASNYLQFTDVDSGQNYNSFNYYWSGLNEYFVTIEGFSSGEVFASGYQTFDLRMHGYTGSDNAAVGDLASYAVQFDLVNIGTGAAETITNTALYSYVNAKGGDDIILGASHDETLVGDGGNDTISGGLGDDTIIDAQGTNTLAGDAGNDTFDLSGSTTPKGTIDGGEGVDTLIVAAHSNWSDLQISDVEVLEVNGDPGLTVAEALAKGFVTVNGATFTLARDEVSGSIDASALLGNLNLRGSNQSDVLMGNAGDNTIYLGEAYDWASLTAGLAVDTVAAGAGDDQIVLKSISSGSHQSWRQFFSSVDAATKTYYLEGDFDGGQGFDQFQLDFSVGYWRHAWGGDYAKNELDDWYLDLTKLALSNIEQLSIMGSGNATPAGYSMTVAQLNGLTAAQGLTNVTLFGGGAIDLDHMASLGLQDDWQIGDATSYTITGTNQSEQLLLGSGTMTVDMLGGDDTLVIDGAAAVTGSLDGGDGTDTLKINAGDVDLSNASLANIEAIDVAANSLAMSQAQWETYGSMVSVRTGASTQFTLSVDVASTITLAEDATRQGLSGSQFDDSFIGNSANNVLTGNDGNDSLQGKGGNDRLIAGAGTDTLLGGSGNDRIDVRGKAVVYDVIAGGDDVDTLVVENGQDLTAATITGIEAISGSGTISLRVAQLEGIKNLYDVSVQLIDESNILALPADLNLSSGSRILMAAVDTEVDAVEGVVGSAKDDVITGSDNADVLYGGRGSDTLDGGAGNDVLDGGKGTNTLIGGEGDDQLLIGGSAINQSNQFISGNTLLGGEGVDTLAIDYNNQYGTSVKLDTGVVSGIENVLLKNVDGDNHLQLSSDLWSSLDRLEVSNVNGSYYYQINILLEGTGKDIDFGAVQQTASVANRLILTDSFAHIDLSTNPVWFSYTNNPEYDDVVQIIDDFVQLSGSYQRDNILVFQDGSFTADLGAGDDNFILGRNDYINYRYDGENTYARSGGSIKLTNVVIDGGDGHDTLDVSKNSYIDLTNLLLNNVENVYYGATNVVVTDTQYAQWSLDGTGAVYTSDGAVITGTKNDDVYSGNGAEKFAGGEGDDSISNVNTAVFTGNYADYDFIPGQSFTIQHARGSMADGTDTLNNVLNLQFANTTTVIDDHVNEPGYYLNTGLEGAELSAKLGELSLVEYDKRVSGKFDYANDYDVYSVELAPNSPLAIEASTANGNTTLYYFYDAETGQQLRFKSTVLGSQSNEYFSSFDANDKWMPGFGSGDQFTPYQGGEVVVRVQQYYGISDVEDYAFTLKYLDDYAGSADTLGNLDPQAGQIKGYIGDVADHDWIRTELIAGTKYEWLLEGMSSGGGSLADPELALRDSDGLLIESGIAVDTSSVGTNDTIIYRPTENGTYYLDVSDIADVNLGSWTLSQQSLDTIAGNVSTTERIDWSSNTTFRVESEINQHSDHDWFKVWLDKGITYDLTLDGTSLGGTLQDPQLSLRSAAGRLLAQDDNGGTGTDAALFYSAPDSGWYYLDAGASGNAFKGTYVLRGSSLQDDFANDRQTTGSVSLTEPTQGLITYIGDSDWFKVGFSTGKTYVLEASQDISDSALLDPLLDPMLIVRDADGKVIAGDDDFGDGLNARLFFTPETNGEYYLEVKSAFKYDIGAYQIGTSLAPADDHASVMGSEASLLVMDNQETMASGVLGEPGDKDVFQIALSSDKVYLFKASGMASNNFTLADPYIRVFDANQQLVDFNDNGGVGNDASFYFAPTETGTYYAEVSSAAYQGMGSFGLQVFERNIPDDDFANDLSTDEVLQPGAVIEGNLLTRNDEDWFAIDLQADESYVFKLKGAFSGSGSLHNPLLELRDAGGVLVQRVYDMLLSNEPAFQYTPAADGRFYLVAKAADGNVDTGTYTLITRAPDDHGNSDNDATAMVLDQTIDGAIQYNDGSFGVRAFDSVGLATDADKDWFTFDATAGDVLSFNASMVDGSTLSRPMVEVVDAAGKTVAIGDGLETNNGLATGVFRAEATGTYYARVTDGAGATGNYQVTLVAGDASDEDSSGSVVLNPVDQNGIVMAEVTASIGLAGDTDTFIAALNEGHNYRIETVAVRDGVEAPLAGTKMALNWLPSVGASETIEVVGESTTPSLFAATGFSADVSGNLSILVAAPELMQTGQYKVRLIDLGVTIADDYVDAVADFDEASHGVLAINENQTGNISEAGDIDLFAVNLTSGNIYDFSVKSFFDGLGSLGESQLKLLSVDGQLVTAGSYDSDTGRTDLSVSVFENGRYFLQVSAVELPGNAGTYTLDTRLRGADDLTDDAAANTQTSLVVAPGQPITANIDYAGDHDWIKVDLQVGKVYVLDILGNGDGAGGSLEDAYMRLLDSNGNEVAMDDNSGAGKDAHIQFTPTATGSYYLDVTGTDAATGTYTARVRELYSGVADPLRASQWYLDAAHVDELQGEFTGAGITVSIVDDGIDSTHPDLQANMDLAHAYDTQFDTQDGNPKYPKLVGAHDDHGTLVAGIVGAVANNETGLVGAAPDVELVSTRVKWSWEHITEALSRQWEFDVSNNSWGAINPFSDNFNSTTLTFAWHGIREAIEDGRDGLGTVMVFSAGNSAGSNDNTNYHNFQNAREVITVGAMSADDAMASFSTPGANVLISTYGEGMATTDRHQPGWGVNKSDLGDYVSSFSGTSASAPLVSGIVANMLEANGELGYRDVQKILAYSATHSANQSWKSNGADDWNLGGLQFNDKSGFGGVDAFAAVQLAKTWDSQNTALNEAYVGARKYGLVDAIPDGNDSYSRSFEIDADMGVEHVELGIDLRHSRLGDLIITLASPDGTVSTLMDRPTVTSERPFGLSGADSGVPTHLLWDFSSVQFWGEDAAGTWTVNVQDVRSEETGTIQSISLRVYGERENGNDVYVFTDEGFVLPSNVELADEYGVDTINGAAVRTDTLIDLAAGIIASNGVEYAIADWTVIENAYSGIGDDRLVGNDADNILLADDGNDVIKGGLGNDTIDGGSGSDTAIYAGNLSEYQVSWNAATSTLTVIDNAVSLSGDEGSDSLTNVERLVFADGEMNLAATVGGNQPPVANTSVFDTPLQLEAGMGINYQLPDNAFSDADGEVVSELDISISMADGSEVPTWMGYDAATGTITGVPPEDYQGIMKIKVDATDDFGESGSGILQLLFGDNQAPIVDAAAEQVIAEDAGLVSLGISAPIDPEGANVTVTITQLPSFGSILNKAGNAVSVGAQMSADELSELHYQTSADAAGNAGYLRYEATDADGVVATSSVKLFVAAVDDAPRFTTDASQLSVVYEGSEITVDLDMQTPTDPEETLHTVRVNELPEIGVVTLNGVALQLEQVLSMAQLHELQFTLSENVNGPIGGVGIQALDSAGNATNWLLALQVNGDQTYSQGTSGEDQLYGSIANDILYGLAGDDQLVGNAGNDRLLAGLGNDTIFGGSGADMIDGSAGNDYLDGGLGSDTLAGGPGHDTYIVDASGDIVLEVIAGGAGGYDIVVTSIDLVAPTNVEGLMAADGVAIDLTGNNLDNDLSGNEMANALSGASGRDYLLGEGGDDILNGGSGVDSMYGGAGDDTYYVDSRADVIGEHSAEGHDSVYTLASYTLASNVEDLYATGSGNITLGGNSLDNHLVGNSGDNILAGGLGADVLEGGAGNDIYVINDQQDSIIDISGIDTIRSTLDVTLMSDIEHVELVGIANTTATGNGGDNQLTGNLADNILDGRGGEDTLTGGSGADQFVVSANTAGLDLDFISDFVSGEDLLILDLASFGVDVIAAELQSSGLVATDAMVSGAGVEALDQNDHFLFDSARGTLLFDADGAGAGAAIALVDISSDGNELLPTDVFVVI